MDKAAKLKRLKVARIGLLLIVSFISLGAYLGGMAFLIRPDGSILGMQDHLKYFAPLPFSEYLFQDYIFSGIALIIVNGISNSICAYALLKQKRIGYLLGASFGITLMLWISLQFYLFPVNAMDIIFFLLGFIQLIFSLCALIFEKQTHFSFDQNNYSINPHSQTLVVYFSRMGYARKLAYEVASKFKANIFEIKVQERTANTLGFWWCGRFGMHRWSMNLINKVDLRKYDSVIIVGQIWVFKMSSPIRAFIKKYRFMLKKKLQTIYLAHFNNYLPQKAKTEIYQLLRKKVEIVSYSSRFGNLKKKN